MEACRLVDPPRDVLDVGQRDSCESETRPVGISRDEDALGMPALERFEADVVPGEGDRIEWLA
jgi:hypothetical protein